MRFILNGCDISFVAEAPEDMTVKQLIAQADRIKPDYCACGVCSDTGHEDFPTEIIFDYDDVKKVNDDVACSIMRESAETDEVIEQNHKAKVKPGVYINVEPFKQEIHTEPIIAMMPLQENVPTGHPDWELRICPVCGRKCWYQTENMRMLETSVSGKDILLRCTECAIREPYDEIIRTE